MVLEKAIETVRSKYPKNFIRGYFIYGKDYIFNLSMDEKNLKEDLATFFVKVDSDSFKMELFDFVSESYNEPDRLMTEMERSWKDLK